MENIKAHGTVLNYNFISIVMWKFLYIIYIYIFYKIRYKEYKEKSIVIIKLK